MSMRDQILGAPSPVVPQDLHGDEEDPVLRQIDAAQAALFAAATALDTARTQHMLTKVHSEVPEAPTFGTMSG